jgi:hypothetical protein
MKNTESATEPTRLKAIVLGNVYVMTHSFFSDVVRIGCTPDDPQEYAKSLSAKTIGDYHVVFSLLCSNPCKVKNQIKKHLNAQKYAAEFYQVPPDFAGKLLRREALKIPTLTHV